MHKADNLPPSCAVVMKSGSLNFLEPSGPVQACNGTDLPLPYMFQLLNSHLQACSLQVTSQDTVYTLGSQCLYISEIPQPDNLQMIWLKYFTDVNTMGSQCVQRIWLKYFTDGKTLGSQCVQRIWLKYFTDGKHWDPNVCTASCDLTRKE